MRIYSRFNPIYHKHNPVTESYLEGSNAVVFYRVNEYKLANDDKLKLFSHTLTINLVFVKFDLYWSTKKKTSPEQKEKTDGSI